MGIFYLKRRDTRTVLVAYLKNPDGSAHDLTGASAVHLHIRLSDGTRLIRPMVIDPTPTTGIVRYTWLATDWDAQTGTLVDGAYPTGGLVVTPGTSGPGGFVIATGRNEHRMEYEVVNGTARLTFPNDGYDVLRITDDIGQGA
jgi:hypothetical protein